MLVTPEVKLIAKTDMTMQGISDIADLTGWLPENDGDSRSGSNLIEFAGRACYESWDRPNPTTATNAGYIKHILEVGHFSVLEHSSFTFYIRGVSRSLTHELVRHRHFGYSQLSQRYVDPGEGGSATGNVIPPAFADDEEIVGLFNEAVEHAESIYTCIIGVLQEKRPGLTRKEYRQAARAVLPNMHETRIVVTGNFRALRHFFSMRCTEAADVEIREVAIMMLKICQQEAPNVFGDFVIEKLIDGTEAAFTPNHEA